MSKKLVLALFLVIPFFAFSQNTQIKLGHLDAQGLLLIMAKAENIEETIGKLSEQHENEMKRMQDELSRKLAEYKQGETTWDETIKQNRAEELQTLDTKMQNYYQTARRALEQKQEELLTPLKDKLRKAIKEVGTENGFLYIFEDAVLLFKSEQAIDVTSLVNKKLGIK